MKNYQLICEALFFNKQDTLYKVKEWKQSTNGLLFITGYTGSGKSTLGKQLAKRYKAQYMELDDEIGQIVTKRREELRNKIKKQKIHFFEEIINNYFHSLFQKKFTKPTIIEGIQIFLFNNPSKFKPHSVIVIGTSTLTSFYRAYKRNSKDKEYTHSISHWWGLVDDIAANMFFKKVERFRKLIQSWIYVTNGKNHENDNYSI